MKFKISILLMLSMLLLTTVAYGSTIPFDDLENHWARDEIMELVNKGIVEGIGNNKMAPDQKLTRAQFTALIARVLDGYQDASEGPYWYSSSYEFALENNLVPLWDHEELNSYITREEMMDVVYRGYFYGSNDKPIVKAVSGLKEFVDYTEIDESYIEAFSWAYGEELIKGKGNNRLAPKDFLTRGEGMVILNRFIKKQGVPLVIENEGKMDVTYSIEGAEEGKVKITLFWGEKPTGGYSIHIKDIKVVGNVMEIEYYTTSPAPGAMVTQALTYPKDSKIIIADYKADYQVNLQYIK